MAAMEWSIMPAEGGLLAPEGFVAAGVTAGIKRSGKRDMCIIAASHAVPSAAVFTVNKMAAPPVAVSRGAVASGFLRAWVVNAGNANACTGVAGLADAELMTKATAAVLDCEASDVGVASTGVIGVPLPMERVIDGISAAGEGLGDTREHSAAAAAAVLTTDTFAKEAANTITIGDVTYKVGGMAKGSGMIMPDMATMLAFITTDAPLTPEACRRALSVAVDATFNRITVDGDSSTNDTCALMASGAVHGEPIGPEHAVFPALVSAIRRTCADLARMIVRDGEGATKLVTVTVRGAVSELDAEDAARTIANSLLVKTALFGGDANWGRVAMALGNSSAQVDPTSIEIVFAGLKTFSNGIAVRFSEEKAAAALSREEVEIVVDLHLGECEATVLTCDLSYEYVRINGKYRT